MNKMSKTVEQGEALVPAAKQVPEGKKAYRSPQLVTWGTLTELTKAGTGKQSDFGGSSGGTF
jgi:hypothetical protein